MLSVVDSAECRPDRVKWFTRNDHYSLTSNTEQTTQEA